MQTLIKWMSAEYNSEEELQLVETEDGFSIRSIIKGEFESQKFTCSYVVEVDKEWNTSNARVDVITADFQDNYSLHKKDGEWILNDRVFAPAEDCADIDILVTPFTNSLPIRRLELSIGRASTISVVYFDVFERKVSVKQQRYSRLTDHTYRFENIPNDFEAVIEVDAEGFVLNYPELFERRSEER